MADENRSSVNEELKNGLILKSRSGKLYTVTQYQTVAYTDRDGSDKELITYKLTDSHRKKIGTVTQYTTQERVMSVIERYENPNHMSEFEYIARIGEVNGFLYVGLPEPLRDWNDVLIDDELEIIIEKKNGQKITDICHHVSKNNATYIINLRRMRRYFLDDDGNQCILSLEEYKKINKSQLFIKKGDVVKVRVIPDSANQNLFLADSMIEDVKLLRKRSGE